MCVVVGTSWPIVFCIREVDRGDGAVSVVRMRGVDTVDSTVSVILIRC